MPIARHARRTLSLLLAVALALPLPAAAQLQPKDFDAFVGTAVKNWSAPGLAVAVVREDSIVHMQGYGVRDNRSRAPVDADTIFGIGSCTKSMVAATVGALVDAGRMHWDDPVTRHIPWFSLPNVKDADDILMRDLLAMRTGLAGSPDSFRATVDNREELVRRMRYLPVKAPFRDRYVYTTDNFTAAGLAVTSVSGLAWDEYAAKTLWQPLGMTRTNGDHKKARAMANSASPHVRRSPASWSAVRWVYEDDAALPAGGVNASVHDMAKWLRFQLAEGVGPNGRILSRAAIAEMHRPHNPDRNGVEDSDFNFVDGSSPVRFVSYALGWMNYGYRAERVVWHTGSIDGFKCTMMMIPDRRFGVVVLQNSDEYMLGLAIARKAIDLEIAAPATDWSSAYLAKAGALAEREAAEEARLLETRDRTGATRHPLQDYSGKYIDKGGFGPVRMTAGKDGLSLHAGRLVYDVKHWSGDSFEVTRRWHYPYGREFFLTFTRDEAGRVDGFDTSIDFRFTRVR